MTGSTSHSGLSAPEPRPADRSVGMSDVIHLTASAVALPELSADAVSVLEAAAVFGTPFSLDDVAAVLGEQVGHLLPVLHELVDEVIVPDGNRLQFRHDAARESVYDRIPEPIRWSLHRQIGTVLLGRGASAAAGAAHLVKATGPGDRHAIAGLDRAVRELAERSPQAAAELAVQAHALTEPTDADRDGRAVAAVDALLAAKRVDEAVRLARATLGRPRLAPGPAARLRLTLATILLMSGQPARAVAEAGSVRAEPMPERLRDAAELTRLFGWLVTDDFAPAQAAAEAILAGDERPGSDAALAGGLTALGWIAWCQGRLDSALGLVRAAVARAARVEPHGQHPRLVLAGMLTALGDLDDARIAVQQASDEIELSADTLWAAQPPLFDARRHLAAGELDDAVQQAEQALALAEGLGLRLVVAPALVTLAQAAVRRGDLPEAAALLERARQEPVRSAGPFGATAGAWAEARLAEARDGAAAALTVVGDWYEALPQAPALLLQEPDAAAWLTRIALATGQPERAQAVVACARQLAAANPDVPSVAAAAAHARGLVEADVALLERAATGYRNPWPVASATEDAGLAYGGDAEPARAAFEQALDWYQRAGAARDAARVRARLRELGVRPCHWTRADRPVSGWASLTDTERRVAEIVAEGLTNAQVGERMFVSRYTVDFHLRQVFRKLSIRSRVELARLALQRGEPADRPAAGGSAGRGRPVRRALSTR
jgi:DNA-binding CsgD family transcriptional regulator